MSWYSYVILVLEGDDYPIEPFYLDTNHFNLVFPECRVLPPTAPALCNFLFLKSAFPYWIGIANLYSFSKLCYAFFNHVFLPPASSLHVSFCFYASPSCPWLPVSCLGHGGQGMETGGSILSVCMSTIHPDPEQHCAL